MSPSMEGGGRKKRNTQAGNQEEGILYVLLLLKIDFEHCLFFVIVMNVYLYIKFCLHHLNVFHYHKGLEYKR